MEDNSLNKFFQFSPLNKPFLFEGWLELPFPVSIKFDENLKVEYKKNVQAELRMTILSNLYKVVTNNSWSFDKAIEKTLINTKSDFQKSVLKGWIHEYVKRMIFPNLLTNWKH